MVEKHTVGRNNAATLMRAIHTQLHHYRQAKKNDAQGLAGVIAFQVGLSVQKALTEVDSYSGSAQYDRDQVQRIRAHIVNAL